MGRDSAGVLGHGDHAGVLGYGDSASALMGTCSREFLIPTRLLKRLLSKVNKSCCPSLLGHCGGRLPQDHGKGQDPCPRWSGHRWQVAPARLLRATLGSLHSPKSLGMPQGDTLLPWGGHHCPEGMGMGWDTEMG